MNPPRPPLSAEMQALAEAVADIVVARLRAELPRKRKENLEARLLSKKAAARLLGIDLHTSLEDLIRSKRIHTVTVAGRLRIPAYEIDRIEREGATKTLGSASRRRVPTSVAPPVVADEILKARAIRID